MTRMMRRDAFWRQKVTWQNTLATEIWYNFAKLKEKKTMQLPMSAKVHTKLGPENFRSKYQLFASSTVWNHANFCWKLNHFLDIWSTKEKLSNPLFPLNISKKVVKSQRVFLCLSHLQNKSLFISSYIDLKVGWHWFRVFLWIGDEN